MIPLELTIEGLYSYRSKAVIDFSPLVEAGLFGIFGAVGSGKSTILDGISLALYGESDRLSGREKKNYNLMNLQSNTMRIEFRCLHEGEEYLFTMEGDRNRRNFNEVKNVKRRAYRRTDGEWIPLNDARYSYSAEDVLGIGYRNFFRTIIIPQGKFQEFLQLQPARRRDMMQELFHLDRYDLYSPAKRLMGRTVERKNIIQGRLDQLADVNAGALRNLKKELKETEALLQEHKEKKSELQSLLHQFDELSGIHLELRELRQEEEQVQSREEELSARREALEEYIGCSTRFRHPLNRLEERIEEYRTARRELKEDLATERAYIADEQRILEELSEIQPMYDGREQLLEKARQVSLVLDLRGAEAGEQEISGEQERNRVLFREKSSAIEQMNAKKKQLQADIDAIGDKAGFYTRTEGLYQWYADHRSLKQIIEEKSKKLDAADNLIEERRDSVLHAADELQDFFASLDLITAPQIGKSFSRLIEKTIEKIIEKIKEEADQSQPDFQRIPIDEAGVSIHECIDRLEKTGARQEAQRLLLTYSRELEDGEPCPLCGALEHPSPLHLNSEQSVKADGGGTKDGPGAVSSIEPLLGQLRHVRDRLLSARGEIKGLLRQVSDSREQKSRMVEDLTAADENLRKHLDTFNWQEFDPENEEKFNKAAREAGEAQKQTKKMADQIRQVDASLEKEKEELEEIRGIQEKVNEEGIRVQEKIKGFRKGIAPSIEEEYSESTNEEIGAAAQGLEAEHERIEEQYRNLGKQQKDLSEKLNRLRGTIKQKRTHCDTASGRIAGLGRELRELLHSSQYDSLHSVRKLLSQKIDQEEERNAIEAFDRKREAVARRTAEMRKKLEAFESDYDQQEHSRLREDLAGSEEKIAGLTAVKGDLQGRSAALADQLKTKKQLNLELKEIEQRIAHFNILLALFKGKGFIDFVATRYLHDLCSLANSRFFHLTHKHLRLEVNEENEFVIRDFLNGGRVRSVKTLSGGQLFQASFSLALALADSIQQNREGFFFIDEGFGALDHESIEEVCTTLKSLRRENRVVGVISHLEQLRSEIPVYLKVENRPEEGSVVAPRWE